MKAPEHAVTFQSPDPDETTRRRKSDLGGKFLVGQASIISQPPDYFVVDSVKRLHITPVPKKIRSKYIMQ
jgi:hypothetical protein